MFGAILGDIIGSPYEFDMGNKSKDFPLFSEASYFTDDTVMTIAVADGLMKAGCHADDETIREHIIDAMHFWGPKYPDAGYGSNFGMWLYLKDRNPYNSFGNGSAMRVSAAGWFGETLDDTRRLARLSAEVTHNHPEGVKGAEATASAIYMARHGHDKAEIKAYIIKEFAYDLSRTCDEIRPGYRHVESCQQTVPEAITAFLEGEDFEDVIRTAVSLGGDCDTLTAIAGSIAEAYYGIPHALKMNAYQYLDADLNAVLAAFEQHRHLQDTAVGDATFDKANLGAALVYGPFVNEHTGEDYVLAFTTLQTAETAVYPYMTAEQVELSRLGVEKFYADSEAQVDWQQVIDYPVVFAVNRQGKKRPVYLSQTAPDFIDLQKPKMIPFAMLGDTGEGEWTKLWG